MIKPKSDDSDDRSEATPGGLIRLGCCYCDRDDFDGVDVMPKDWINIQPVEQQALGIWENGNGSQKGSQ